MTNIIRMLFAYFSFLFKKEMRNMQIPKCKVWYFGYHHNQKYKDLCQAETKLKKGKEED